MEDNEKKWPGEGDSNSRRYDPRWFSRPVHSTALPSPDKCNDKIVEATPGFEPGIRALQAPALATWLCRHTNRESPHSFHSYFLVVPGAGLEPAQLQ